MGEFISESNTGRSSKKAPANVKLVAGSMLVSGLSAAAGMLLCLFNGSFSFDFTVLDIFAARGLLRGVRGWRTYALFWRWVGMIVIAWLSAMLAMGATPERARIFGVAPARLDALPASLMLLAAAALLLWQYSALTGASARRHFGLPPRKTETEDGFLHPTFPPTLLPLLVSATLFAGLLALYHSLPTSRDIPSFVSTQKLEKEYAQQIDLLSMRAKGMFGPNKAQVDDQVFAPPEILEAKIEHRRSGGIGATIIGQKHLRLQSYGSFLAIEPQEGKTVVNRLFCVTREGRPMDIIEYRQLFQRVNRGTVEGVILFDPEKLAERLKGR